MRIQDLDFSYPEALVATEPHRPSRVLWVEKGEAREVTPAHLLAQIPAGDVLVINNTKVLKRRIFSANNLEILFLSSRADRHWEVLFPSKKYAVGDVIELPQNVQMTLVQKGRPQIVQLSREVTEDYFEQVAELPLPPYIQKAREERHNVASENQWYQTDWAEQPGSFAAPTASLHFKQSDLQQLRDRGVHVVELTLHVGLGTFLPVQVEDLSQHEMHEEWVEIPAATWLQIQRQKSQGHKIWAMGTTVTRALESAALGLISVNARGDLQGSTKIMIAPGHQWRVVDRLLTNFHQPKTTLLALVAAFSDLPSLRRAYDKAISLEMKLFSYGALSVWIT